jgi:hypothetical protein
MSESVDQFLARFKLRDPDQPEFHQAVEEVLRSLWPFLEANRTYMQAGIVERMVEPERAILFRVPWVDDNGRVAGQPWLSGADEQRDWPLQGRPALSTPRSTSAY